MNDSTTNPAIPPRDIPVLIVGAGPTGLTLAIELARRNVPFRLIDKDPEPTQTSRALGTHARTVEVFGLMGMPREALQPSLWVRSVRSVERGKTLATMRFGGPADDAGPRILVMEQSVTERLLGSRLEQLGGRVEQSVELLGFRVAGDHVVATLKGLNSESEQRARFLVGADGAQSIVRRDAGIAFAGSAYPEQFLLADVNLELATPPGEGLLSIGDDGLIIVIPLPDDGRYRLIASAPPDLAGKDFDSEAEIATAAETRLRRLAHVEFRRLGEPIWASAFRISRRQAERYREGSVFLAGDAAHVHSPVGGQGMNTGIQDAFNLGWKLALAVRGQAAPGLLDTYEAERQPIASDVLRGTHLVTRFYLSDTPVARTFRAAVLRAVDAALRVPSVRRRMLEAVGQLDVAYPDSPLSIDATEAGEKHRRLPRFGAGGLKPGHRVPDAMLVEAASAEPVSLFDLIARGWLLLLFPGDTSDAATIDRLERLAEETRRSAGAEVASWLVLGAPLAVDPPIPALLDQSGAITGALGARQGLVALVRPDGYLGYRGRPGQPGDLASYLARVFAMRLRAAGEDRRHAA